MALEGYPGRGQTWDIFFLSPLLRMATSYTLLDEFGWSAKLKPLLNISLGPRPWVFNNDIIKINLIIFKPAINFLTELFHWLLQFDHLILF